jgi:hypothetical protein
MFPSTVSEGPPNLLFELTDTFDEFAPLLLEVLDPLLYHSQFPQRHLQLFPPRSPFSSISTLWDFRLPRSLKLRGRRMGW